MVRVVFHDRIDALAPELVRRVDAFLARHIPEGAIELPFPVYRNATIWALAMDGDEILGFAAQRRFDDTNASIIQIMGTYLAPRLRGSLMASTLLQGEIFFRTWIRAPLRPIFWCTRTRVPAVYRTAARFHDIYPKLDSPGENREMSELATRIARLVYGERATLDPDTFVLRRSYVAGTEFLPLRHARPNPVHEAFARVLDYRENEAVFILSRFDARNIARYLVANAAFRTRKKWRDIHSSRHLVSIRRIARPPLGLATVHDLVDQLRNPRVLPMGKRTERLKSK